MKATLIFDNVNDLVFSKWNEAFLERVKSFSEQESESLTDHHNVAQLLSPIITSQRVMAAQFGNTYSSMQCKDKTTIVFDEWLDHVFLIICEENVDDAHRELMDCKTFVQHICGQNISLLHSAVYQTWLTVLLESRGKGDSVPGASGVIGESGATAAALQALKAASKDVKCSSYNHYHFMLFVGDKLLALYSSRGCEDLTPPDLILMSIQCIAAQEFWKDLDKGDDTEQIKLPWLSCENSGIVHLCAGVSSSPSASASAAPAPAPAAPHSLHVAEVAPRVTLALLVDMELRDVGIATSMTNQILSNLRRLLLQRNLEMLPNSLDSLEAALKKTTDALKKHKAHSQLCARLNARMVELRKSCSTTTPLTPDTTAGALLAALEPVVDLLKPDIPALKLHRPVNELKTILAPYVDFLKVKAMRYFSLESCASETERGSLTLHKYVSEFPGLVHFVYVDRAAGRVLAPDAADAADMLTKDAIRSTLSRSLSLVREGYCAGTWRRGALHACCVLWWERGGTPARPAPAPHPAAVRALPPPGDILGTFYRQLVSLSFPGDSAGVSVKELTCIHLGLLPAPTAVQQARRLAHTLMDLTSEGLHAPNPADLL